VWHGVPPSHGPSFLLAATAIRLLGRVPLRNLRTALLAALTATATATATTAAAAAAAAALFTSVA